MNNSYHDVVIASNNRLYILFNLPFSVRLMCTRVGGWELWNMCGNGEKDNVLAGEYAGPPFTLYVKNGTREAPLEPTEFCAHRFTKEATDIQNEPEKTLIVGNEEIAAVWDGFNLTLTGRDDLLEMVHEYVSMTASIFWGGYLFHVSQHNRVSDKYVLTISNPKTDFAA